MDIHFPANLPRNFLPVLIISWSVELALSLSLAAINCSKATQRAKIQTPCTSMKARKAAAKQKRDASAQSEGEQMKDGEAEPQQECQPWLLMELVRELQAPTQKATTTQEIHSQETEEEQSQMEVTEADAEPEADQEEADQMRDTDERRTRKQPTREQRANYPPGYESWSSSKKGNWRRRRKEKGKRP